MMSMTAKKKLAVLLLSILQFIGMGTVAEASLITFEVSWAAGMTIPDANSKVIATGLVTIDTTLLPNPGNYFGDVTPLIRDFTINVTGATVGNGSFDLSSYRLFYWSTGIEATDGGSGVITIDLTQELVGQPFPNGVGFLRDRGGPYGEFNFLAKCDARSTTCDEPIAPTGVDTFTMRTFGGLGDYMIVSSIRPVAVSEPIPEPTMLPIVGVALIAFTQFVRRVNTGTS